MLHFPILRDFTSVPASAIPHSNLSSMKKSKYAFLLFAISLNPLLFAITSSSFPFRQECPMPEPFLSQGLSAAKNETVLSFVEIPHRKEIDRFQIPVHRDDLDLHGLAKLEFLSRPLSHQFIVFLIKHIVVAVEVR